MPKFEDLVSSFEERMDRVILSYRMAAAGHESASNMLRGEFEAELAREKMFTENREGTEEVRLLIERRLAPWQPKTRLLEAGELYFEHVDAAGLVFAHSVLDAAMFECLERTAAVFPFNWLDLLGDRKASIHDVFERGPEEVFSVLLSAELKKLERESLLIKIDRLYALAKPRQEFLQSTNLKLDRGKLDELDRARHDAVHGQTRLGRNSMRYSDLLFLRGTGAVVLHMLQAEYRDLRTSGGIG